MNEEIFGPILPVIAFQTKQEAMAVISRNKNPLAFYIFTSDNAKGKRMAPDSGIWGRLRK